MFLVGSIIRNQYIPSIGLFYKNWEDCGGLSDLWRISGGYSQEMSMLHIIGP